MSPYERYLKRVAAVGALADTASVLSPRCSGLAPADVRRIGVLAQWGIGDAILLLPLLQGLRRAYLSASIELIGKPWLAELMSGEGCCDRTHVLVPPWTAYTGKYRPSLRTWGGYVEQLRALRRHNFDWLIATRFDPRETLQMRLLRARRTFGFRAAGGRRWITDDFGITRAAHDALHRAALAARLSWTITGSEVSPVARFHNRPAEQGGARQWFLDHGYQAGAILAVHTGAGNPIRRWRESGFAGVLRLLRPPPSFTVFLMADDNGRRPDPSPLPHAFWRNGLAETKELLSLCDVFLGTDSGIMHMAAASGCAVVTAFGPTEPRWFGPSGDRHAVAKIDPMPCRPCYDACIYERPFCMEIEDAALAACVAERLVAAQLAPRATMQ